MQVISTREAEQVNGGAGPLAAAAVFVLGAAATWAIEKGLEWLATSSTPEKPTGRGTVTVGEIEVICQGHLKVDYDAESNYASIRCF